MRECLRKNVKQPQRPQKLSLTTKKLCVMTPMIVILHSTSFFCALLTAKIVMETNLLQVWKHEITHFMVYFFILKRKLQKFLDIILLCTLLINVKLININLRVLSNEKRQILAIMNQLNRTEFRMEKCLLLRILMKDRIRKENC